MARVTLAPKARKSKLQAPAPKRDGNPLKTGSLAPQPAASLSIAEAIGTQVRNLRRKLDLTGAELADQAALSAGMLPKIENGAVSASIDSLEALARALNVPLTTFFASYEEQRDCSHVRAGQGVTIERRGTKAGNQISPASRPFDFGRGGGRALPNHPHRGGQTLHHVSACRRRVHLYADRQGALPPCRQGLSVGARRRCCSSNAAALHGPEELTKLPMTYLSIIVYPRT